MDKSTYIEQLRNALDHQVSDETMEKILEYYEQYFDDAADFGRQEQDVIADLKDPQILAREVLDGLQLKACDIFTSQDNVRMIDMALLDIRVHLVFCQHDRLSVTYQGVEDFDPSILKVDYKSNHLRIIQEAKRLVAWSDLSKEEQKPYLLVELPMSYKGKLLVNTRASRIIVDGKNLETKVHCHLSSKSAKIECNDLKCRDVEAISESGRIKMVHCQMKTMDLETRSGRIDLEKCQVNYVQVRSQSGQIILSKSNIELAELENNSGRIMNNESFIDDCRMQNESGRIYYELTSSTNGLHLDLLSRQGKVSVNGEKLPKGILAIKDIKIKKKEKRYLNVYARTSSGRIEIIH